MSIVFHLISQNPERRVPTGTHNVRGALDHASYFFSSYPSLAFRELFPYYVVLQNTLPPLLGTVPDEDFPFFFLPEFHLGKSNPREEGNRQPGPTSMINFNIPRYPCFIGRRPLAPETQSGADCRFIQVVTRGSNSRASRPTLASLPTTSWREVKPRFQVLHRICHEESL